MGKVLAMDALAWRDISYEVALPGGLFERNKQAAAKQILRDVSGFARAGEILAIMGPSGSGKSSLLDILASRKNTGKVTGEILLDGAPCVTTATRAASGSVSRAYARKSAYILQDDTLYEHLTVRETLVFSAQLRLPESLPSVEKLKRVDEVMRSLGIEKVADTKVGGPFVRGVSGGERKRVSIGCELLKQPLLLLLDEPTSGLSSSDARTVLKILRTMAASGHAVVTTIHQPSAQLYTMFDRVMLLSCGRAAYFGPARRAVSHFEGLGISSGLQMNAAEFLLDAVCTPYRSSGSSSPRSPQSKNAIVVKPTSLDGDRDRDPETVRVVEVVEDLSSEPAAEKDLVETATTLAERFAASAAGHEAAAELESLAPRVPSSTPAALSPTTPKTSRTSRYVVSRLTQIRVVARRDFIMWLRDPNLFLAVVFQGVFLGILAASSSRGAGGATTEMMRYQLLFFLAVMS
eukprot:tig00000523_g1848.t1